MKKVYFRGLAFVLIVCVAVLSACAKKSDAANDAPTVNDSTHVVDNATTTILARFQAVYLNSNGAIYVFNDLDGNTYEFFETDHQGKGMDEFMRGVRPNVVDPKFDKILYEVSYSTQQKQFYVGATGDYETRDVIAIVEIKEVSEDKASLHKPTSVFTPELIKSLMAFGTEPFWDIKFKETHAEYNDPNLNVPTKIYYRKDNNDNSRAKLSDVLRHINANTVEILCVMNDAPGYILIIKQSCSDGMSDDDYAYSVAFNTDAIANLSGCARVK